MGSRQFGIQEGRLALQRRLENGARPIKDLRHETGTKFLKTGPNCGSWAIVPQHQSIPAAAIPAPIARQPAGDTTDNLATPPAGAEQRSAPPWRGGVAAPISATH